MTRWISCGLLLACTLVAARPAAAQEAAGPRTYDLTLEQALDLARARSPSVRVAQARVGEARGRLVDASVLLRANPTLDVGGGPRIGPGGTSPDVDIGVGQVFELGSQRAARIDAANAGVERATATADDASWRSLRDVAATFVRAGYAEERLRIATDTARLAAEIHRYEAGAMQLGELLAVRRELVEARVTHADLLRNAALAGVDLEAEAGVLP